MTELDEELVMYLRVREELEQLAPDIDPALIDEAAQILVENTCH